MKQFIKAVLYAYPLMKTVERDYADHIRNKAVLSYRSDKSAESVALYLAGEILEKRDLEWVKGCVEQTLAKLSDVERTLVEIRYFGKERKIKSPLKNAGNGAFEAWSKRKYFRVQSRLGEKVGAMLEAQGVSEELFEKRLKNTDIFQRVLAFLQRLDESAVHKNERGWLRFKEN